MPETKKYVDLDSLRLYHEKSMEIIDNKIDWNNLKNQPFHEDIDVLETFTKSIKPGYTVRPLEDVINYEFDGLVETSIDLVGGRKYNVTLDNMTYSNLEAYNLYSNMAAGVGNSAMIPFGDISDKDLDLPFALARVMGYWYLICETSGEHEFSIESVPDTERKPSIFTGDSSSSLETSIDTSETYELILNNESVGTSPVMQTSIMGYTVYILGNPDLMIRAWQQQGLSVTEVENLSNIENCALAFVDGQNSTLVAVSEISAEGEMSVSFSVPNLIDLGENITLYKSIDGEPVLDVETDSGVETLSDTASWTWVMNYEAPFCESAPSLAPHSGSVGALSLGDYTIEDIIEPLVDESDLEEQPIYGINLYPREDSESTSSVSEMIKQGYMGYMDMSMDYNGSTMRMTIMGILPELFSTSIQTVSVQIKDKAITPLDKKFVDVAWSDIKEKPQVTDEELDEILNNYSGIFNITDEGSLTVKDRTKLPEDLIIPETLEGIKVKSLDPSEDIEYTGFAGKSNIKTLVIKAPLKEITNSYGAFTDCACLESVVLPSTLKSMGSNTFRGCSSLTEISLPPALEFLDYSCLRETSLTEISIPSTVGTISEAAFEGCIDLKSVEIPSSSELRYLSTSAFEGCTSLTSITLSCPSLRSISQYAFRGCTSLRTAVIEAPDMEVTLNSDIFRGCTALEEVSILTSTTYLSTIFRECGALKKVTLPKTLNTIYSQVFWSCPLLADIYYDGTIEQWNAISKSNNWRTSTITVHCSDGNYVED